MLACPTFLQKLYLADRLCEPAYTARDWTLASLAERQEHPEFVECRTVRAQSFVSFASTEA